LFSIVTAVLVCAVTIIPVRWDGWSECVVHPEHCTKVHSVITLKQDPHPTMAAWVQSQVRSCRICGGQSGIGAGFLWVLWFLLPILIPPTAPHSLIILSLTLFSLILTASLNNLKKKGSTLELNHCQDLKSSTIQFGFQA
jgi:hypothetical protein